MLARSTKAVGQYACGNGEPLLAACPLEGAPQADTEALCGSLIFIYSYLLNASAVDMLEGTPGWVHHLLGVAGVVGALALLLGTLGLGWYVVWCTSLRKLPIAQELMGKRRQSQAQKDQIAKEIRDIKRQHSRRGPSLDLVRQTSIARQVRPAVAPAWPDTAACSCPWSLTCAC